MYIDGVDISRMQLLRHPLYLAFRGNPRNFQGLSEKVLQAIANGGLLQPKLLPGIMESLQWAVANPSEDLTGLIPDPALENVEVHRILRLLLRDLRRVVVMAQD